MKDKLVPLTALVLIATLTVVALINGVDGAMLISSMSIISGIAGYTVGKLRKH